MSQKSSCGNAVPTQFLMWERRSHSISYVGTLFPCVPAHYTTECQGLIRPIFFMPNEGTSIPSFGRTTPSATTNVPIFLKHYDRHFLQYYYFLCINYFMKNN